LAGALGARFGFALQSFVEFVDADLRLYGIFVNGDWKLLSVLLVDSVESLKYLYC
jgi:hypothetical protein